MYGVVKVFVCKIDICSIGVVFDGFGYGIYVVLCSWCFIGYVSCFNKIIVDI